MISRTAFLLGPGGDDASSANRPDAVNLHEAGPLHLGAQLGGDHGPSHIGPDLLAGLTAPVSVLDLEKNKAAAKSCDGLLPIG
jgi:hypothetical protein